MSLLLLLIVVCLLGACVVMALPKQEKPVPIAEFRAMDGTRLAELSLFPGYIYVLKYSPDGKSAASEKGSYRKEDTGSADGTSVHLTDAQGRERELVFEGDMLSTKNEAEGIDKSLSITGLRFNRKL